MRNPAKLLSDFTDTLNTYGAESYEVSEFKKMYVNDEELTVLFNTVLRVKLALPMLKDPTV